MATQSMIAAAKSKLNEIRTENAQIEREIGVMVQAIRNACTSATDAGNNTLETLGNGETMLLSDDNTLIGVEGVRQDIQRRFDLYKNIEEAYKTIRQLNNNLHDQLGNEKVVRRMVMAMVDNEEKTFVTDETLSTQAEKLYTQTQFFFLTYIMMDLQLRRQGKTEAADRARKQALEMDARQSAWVYFMIALKRKNVNEQREWFSKITARPLTGTEKTNCKILTMLSLKEDEEIASDIKKYIGMDKLTAIDKDDVVAEILTGYRGAMTVVPPTFQYLNRYVSEYGELNEALRGAMNNELVGAYVQQVSKVKEEKMRDNIITMMFDTIIESCHSPQAQKILKEIEHQQHIIDAKGVEKEATVLDAKQKVAETTEVNLENCLYEWLNDQENYNGKREISLFAYSRLKPCYKRAYRQYTEEYRKRYQKKVNVTIDSYTTQSTLTSSAEEVVKIEDYCRRRCQAEKEKIKDLPSLLFMIFGGVLLLAGIILNFIPALGSGGELACFLIGIIGGCVLAIVGVAKRYGNYRKRIAAEEGCEREIAKLSEQMQYVISDMEAYREMYKTYDEKALDENFF